LIQTHLPLSSDALLFRRKAYEAAAGVVAQVNTKAFGTFGQHVD
jgi:hypothetical protein